MYAQDMMLAEDGFMPLQAASAGERAVSLALQGGGSFGAFTWGVLDRLLDEEALRFDTISGASAGAVNAVLLAGGMQSGGRSGAKQALEGFWTAVRQAEPAGLLGLAYPAVLRMSAKVSLPFTNPGHYNPLREILAKAVDFERLRAEPPVRLLVAATRVRDGRLRLFREDEISLDAVLASACLPTFQKAVEIEGEAYWDGGFSANPPLRQLVRDTRAADVLLVQIMPEERVDVPSLSSDVMRRTGELAFIAPLQRELEALADLRDICSGPVFLRSEPCRKLSALRFHRIAAVDVVDGLEQENALDTAWSLLTRLREKGREAAGTWLSNMRDA